jgi:hypothetical protein
MSLHLFITSLFLHWMGGSPAQPGGIDPERTRTRSAEALAYCKAHGMNTDFCILVDMSVHSGRKRFLVWDLQADTLVRDLMVAHGSCRNPWGLDQTKEAPQFSNVEGSHCSSLGRYRIGARGLSEWGIRVKYTLHGLDATNSNARDRYIVLHSWNMVPDEEIFPHGTPEGWGCPAIADEALRWLDPRLKDAVKPVLLWIYV